MKGLPAGTLYRYRGAEHDLDPEIRERIDALRAAAAAEPDPGDAGYEWRREHLAESAGPPCPPPAASGTNRLQDAFRPPAASAPEPKPRCDRCGYLAIRCACPGGTR